MRFNSDRFKAVLFDLDNTLVDRDGAFEACLRIDFPCPNVRATLRRLDGGGTCPRPPLLAAWQHFSGQTMGQERFSARLAAEMKPDPSLLNTLDELSQTCKIGLISNGGSVTQRAKMRATGLLNIFEPHNVWISGEVGFAKPDPRIFWLACKSLSERPHNCLYIGDLEDVDGVGARSAGLHYERVQAV